jgi:hypothetical protein
MAHAAGTGLTGLGVVAACGLAVYGTTLAMVFRQVIEPGVRGQRGG